ncbi:MAG TPA: glycoside hydrolase family 130 protein [Puia sp.]|nr:glycoside hydrolase family 130 protein [Puia sp.]
MKNSLCLFVFGILSTLCTAQTIDSSLAVFIKANENPILRPDSAFVFTDPVTGKAVKWQKADVFNPAAIVRNGKICLLYRSEDNPAAIIGGRTSRIGLAESKDGIHFTKFPQPVLYPDNSMSEFDHPGGCEDPRVVEAPDGRYVMIYTSWDGKTARLSAAVSKDLVHWQKQGPVFQKAEDGKYLNTWSKSGSIVTTIQHGRLIAARINGKYWMYWGEQFVNPAWSTNLVDWHPVVDGKGDLKRSVEPRLGKFDSELTECGPPAVLTSKGIVLLYNGKNAESEKADPSLPRGTYSVGQLLFDARDPQQLIARSAQPLLRPTSPIERKGQYKAGTTFSEGLVYFNSKWFLYYGAADSFVCLATSP